MDKPRFKELGDIKLFSKVPVLQFKNPISSSSSVDICVKATRIGQSLTYLKRCAPCLQIFLFVAFISPNIPLTAAENRLKVAVFDFKTVGDSVSLGEEAAETMRTTLRDTGNYFAVERNILKEALRKQKLNPNAALDQDSAVGIGEILKAKRVAIGSITKTGENYALNIRFVDVETGEVMLQKKLIAKNRQDIPGLCRQIVAALSKRETIQEEEQPRGQKSEPRDTESGNWALGGLYSGAALKYVTGGSSAWELRGQTGSGIFAMGSRYYLYFTQIENPRLFCGIEGDYITFKGNESKGAGFAGGAFLGGEIFLTKQIGLLADVGPMYINLAETDYSQSAGNMEYVLNLAIYWHFR